MKSVQLRKGRERALLRKHPWIFSGGLYKPSKNLKNGDHVQVEDHSGRVLAVGHYADSSIAVRILAFAQRSIDQAFYEEKLMMAKNLRIDILKLPSTHTNCYRLISGEGDQLSGLIIDIYDQHAVIQCHTMGMLGDIDMIGKALDHCFDHQLKSIYLKSIHIKNHVYESRFLKGDTEGCIVLENNLKFQVNWVEGQKTGFFLDQRRNRQLLGTYATGKHVLNTFCYTGGFSVYAMHQNAASVHSIDISDVAMSQTDQNIALNNDDTSRHESITGNVIEYLKNVDSDYFDLIILDPPAFAKNKNKSHNAVQAYKRLNLTAMKKIKSQGIIFSFSCSQVIDRNLFEHTVRAAAIESRRNVKLIHHLTQAPDHMINMFHQEGHYLKGVVLVVD